MEIKMNHSIIEKKNQNFYLKMSFIFHEDKSIMNNLN